MNLSAMHSILLLPLKLFSQRQIYDYPNCTIAEYGTLPQDADAIKAEIYARGPVPGKKMNRRSFLDIYVARTDFRQHTRKTLCINVVLYLCCL